MRRHLTATVALAIVSLGAMALAAELKSGLPVGAKTKAFNVLDVTGPNKGKSLCYR